MKSIRRLRVLHVAASSHDAPRCFRIVGRIDGDDVEIGGVRGAIIVPPTVDSAETRVEREVPCLNFTINRPATYGAPDAPSRSSGPFRERIDARIFAAGLSGQP